MRRYQSSHKIIVIWVVNNIIAYRILTTCVRISSNNYRHQTNNNFEKLLAKEDNENTAIIIAPILINIHIHIRLTGFLEDGMPKIVYGTDGKIQDRLIIVF